MRQRHLLLFFIASLLSYCLGAKEIVVGVETIPKRRAAILLTPVVLPDLLSAKAALEIRLYKKLNLILPIEAKWMDYRWAVRYLGKKNEYPEKWYREKSRVTPDWNIDFSQVKVSSGIGVKVLPFSESMTNAFYLKTLFLVGGERFFDYTGGGRQNSAVLTHVLTVGYNWVHGNRFMWGIEVGEEFIYHTDPIRKIPGFIISNFNPLFHMNFGFTI